MKRLLATTIGLPALLLMAACATTPVDPGLLDNARVAIEQAEQAGAGEYSPLELRFAHERLARAETFVDNDDDTMARRMAEQAEVEAQLALARTRAALARAELARKQRELEQIETDIREVFGAEAVEQ
ncbi:DUF4398 domain-containing protein [Wenzhouxiangella sp. AB-CW3]|uniref:DUF4398 domain-containing protein n=1 Tax=Wenzhouxiangella sp. AB-CW3 TaxID=2771012 RepID=UPI00168BF473|nr:DUF4398 domain-containing protein [Wenzhouxiangella sp. AB-CW3]QOC21666.1 DUF4398 domain-containing protein [Wenzhouxiangella sp. AB-CW3]